MTENFHFKEMVPGELARLKEQTDPFHTDSFHTDTLNEFRFLNAQTGKSEKIEIPESFKDTLNKICEGANVLPELSWQNSPFTFEMDPGFRGGRDAIAKRYKQEGEIEKMLLDGHSLIEARRKLGLPEGFYHEGEEQRLRQQAIYDQALRSGMHYQEARLKAGMGYDIDPGFSGGEASIEWHDRAYAWLKEYLRQGLDLDTAEAKAMQKTGPKPERYSKY